MPHVAIWIDIQVSTLDVVVSCSEIHKDLVQFLSEI